jgi:hypothetical protein
VGDATTASRINVIGLKILMALPLKSYPKKFTIRVVLNTKILIW